MMYNYRKHISKNKINFNSIQQMLFNNEFKKAERWILEYINYILIILLYNVIMQKFCIEKVI